MKYGKASPSRVAAWTVWVIVGSFDCASTGPELGPLNRAAMRASHPRTILAPPLPPPPFEGVTVLGNALLPLFGLAGAGIRANMIREDGEAAQKKRVHDPALVIRAKLVQALSKRFSLQIVESVVIQPPVAAVATPPLHLVDPDGTPGVPLAPPPASNQVKTVAQISAEHRDVDLVLEIRTAQWGFAPISLDSYGIVYRGTLRLIDTRTQTMAASGSCESRSVDSNDAPTQDELLANDAMILKENLNSLEEFCTEDYRTRVLGLYGQ